MFCPGQVQDKTSAYIKMFQFPPFLKPSDLTGIIPPASKIPKIFINQAKTIIESWGLKVILSKNWDKDHFGFAGTDKERLQAFQELLDNKEIKCIFCARGGYGTSRIIDQLDLNGFISSPKWIIGYSDITVLLNKLLIHQYSGIHGPMPINFIEDNSEESLQILKKFLFYGTYPELRIPTNKQNRPGFASGELVGGNLTMLTNSIGTSTQLNTDGMILFIEDIDERMYRVDRMLVHMKRAGMFKKLKGLVVGHFTDITERKEFGYSIEELILSHTEKFDFPVCFGAPIGHIMPNYPIIVGAEVSLHVESNNATLALKENPGN
jgi:muramoyltetrapeptide carboxypeptidase